MYDIIITAIPSLCSCFHSTKTKITQTFSMLYYKLNDHLSRSRIKMLTYNNTLRILSLKIKSVMVFSINSWLLVELQFITEYKKIIKK